MLAISSEIQKATKERLAGALYFLFRAAKAKIPRFVIQAKKELRPKLTTSSLFDIKSLQEWP